MRPMPSIVPYIIAALLVLFWALLLYASVRCGRRQRLIANLPTCRTTGVFIGLVELKGTAETNRPLRSHLAECECVHYRWSVAEHWSRTVTETYRDKDGNQRTRTRRESGWTTVGSGGEDIVFNLRDDAGEIQINPAGADILAECVFLQTCGRGDPLYYGKGPQHAVAHSDHRRRFSEQALRRHAPIYVVGPARERADVVAAEIRHDRDNEMFVISTRSEASVGRGYGWGFWGFGVCSVLLATFGLWWLAVAGAHTADRAYEAGRLADLAGRVARDAELQKLVLAAAAGVAGLCWLVAWAWMAFNSLIDLRQRVRQAWANIDVQLKRRADLLPNLVRVVTGCRDHEQRVQREVALLRTQAGATRPGEAGPDPAGCAPVLGAIVEAYPELRADEAFAGLRDELVATEQRIALAREYFNTIATAYNTRLAQVPDVLLASLGRLRPQPLLSAEGFERAPVSVSGGLQDRAR